MDFQHLEVLEEKIKKMVVSMRAMQAENEHLTRKYEESQKTIANYQSIIKQKLEADTSAQIVWIAMRSGVLGGSAEPVAPGEIPEPDR